MFRLRWIVGCLGLLAPLGLAGCDADDDGGTADTDASTGAEDLPESSGATEPPTPQEFEAMCNAITDQAECEAMNEFYDDSATGLACNWETWVSVTLVDGACSFGEVQAGCTFESYSSEGCASWGTCGGFGPYAGVRDGEDGTLELGTSPQGWCFGPYSDACGSDPESENPPECACACDAAWPGA